ncbi:MAG: hypothetical protein GW911_29310 [Armatimonadetes bacterium]|nr:hypothetical protein [Armatimonadota bacterium]NDK16145.1 hypothetical protein [Armatimonadota bacterium]PIX41298.1 MAG: hypothetical protein COZ57_23790 [Armatimonadetes bacterium CG_4_8_14_3_um_filter_66_20]PJB70915.1 MAG: hypothetical protein CO096_10630 [Armatimonadetes bacterium CG_4_9_14_3_um_filter_66_14]
MTDKLLWQGTVIAVQLRIRLTRSFDERTHTYLGYSLRMDGTVGGHPGAFLLGIGKGAQEKHAFRPGDSGRGACVLVPNPRLEPVGFYKVSGIKLLARGPESVGPPPPWIGAPPDLPTYRQRGHRRLYDRTFDTKCACCLWACRMAVEIIVDRWNPADKRYRFETFCYGPKSCPVYKAGPTRKVPGRKGMTWEEEDWVDQAAVAHRGEAE